MERRHQKVEGGTAVTWSNNIKVDAIGLAAEVVDLRRELEQQATLLGKGSEREARLLAENAELQKENAALKAALDHQMTYQRELRADRDRLDWLDKTGCWLTIPGSRKGQKFFAGTARNVIDSEMGVGE